MPATTTLPAGFWMLYYSSLVITFGSSIFAIIRKRNRVLSIINLAMVISIPIISLANRRKHGDGSRASKTTSYYRAPDDGMYFNRWKSCLVRFKLNHQLRVVALMQYGDVRGTGLLTTPQIYSDVSLGCFSIPRQRLGN